MAVYVGLAHSLLAGNAVTLQPVSVLTGQAGIDTHPVNFLGHKKASSLWFSVIHQIRKMRLCL